MARPSDTVQSSFALSFDARLAREIRTAGGQVHILGEARASRPCSVLRARSNLSGLFRQRHFDAVMVHSAWALSLLAHGSKPPLVFYQHDVFNGGHWTEKLARHVYPHLILANSAFTAQTTSQVFLGRHAQVLFPPAALPVEVLSAGERQVLRSRYGVPAQTLVILIAARFEKWKGHGLLLKALALLRQNPVWRLWIAGEPQNSAERQVHECLHVTAAGIGLKGRVQFLGHISHVPALMQAADIYCQPNTGPEPFGLSFVEAMACGLPIVATPLGGVREILEPAWGLLAATNPGDVAAMIERLLEDPSLRSRLGELGKARAVELCDPETQIAAMTRSIAFLLNRKAA
jgi:glycosyltransferase involved in cell wall biosynthesis